MGRAAFWLLFLLLSARAALAADPLVMRTG
jgi:hypothetical protein